MPFLDSVHIFLYLLCHVMAWFVKDNTQIKGKKWSIGSKFASKKE